MRFGLILLLFISNWVAAQPKPNCYFLTDSIEIGRPFRLALSYRHSPQTEVFFPDTTYQFKPFEAIGYEYFDTEIQNGQSLDSAVYTLVAFDLDSVQKLSLPIWIYTKGDCTAVFSNPQFVKLHRTLPKKMTKLEAESEIMRLQQQVNYPYILLILFLLAIVLSGVYLVFGKQINKQWRLFRLYRANSEFKRTLDRIINSNNKKIDIQDIEKGVVFWKKYMERLERKPFTTFTTKEISDELSDQSLAEALRAIDAVIYGGVSSAETIQSLEMLNYVSKKAYIRRRNAINRMPV